MLGKTFYEESEAMREEPCGRNGEGVMEIPGRECQGKSPMKRRESGCEFL